MSWRSPYGLLHITVLYHLRLSNAPLSAAVSSSGPYEALFHFRPDRTLHLPLRTSRSASTVCVSPRSNHTSVPLQGNALLLSLKGIKKERLQNKSPDRTFPLCRYGLITFCAKEEGRSGTFSGPSLALE